jgi:replication-associated recombination protein RarA
VAKYQPKAIADFIGIAEPKAALGALARQPYASAWLLTGPPGLGKTTVAQALFEHLGGQYQHIPARMCDLETVTRVCDSCQCAPMFGGPAGFNLVLADEIEKASTAAQIAWLSPLDSTRFPERTIFIFTSNNAEKLEERFVSRCRHLEFTAPEDSELAAFLAKVWAAETQAAAPDLAAIVAKAKGNVRNALMMLEVKLLVAEPVTPPTPQPVQRTWFDTAKAANDCPVPLNGAKRMKRILVKNAETGVWERVMAEVTA